MIIVDKLSTRIILYKHLTNV